MANYKPMIEESELMFDIYRALTSGKLRSFYVVYDDLTDELIVKFISPESPASVYHKSDNLALLVDPDTNQVVGFDFFRFQSYHLMRKECEDLCKTWYAAKLAEHYRDYQEEKYSPREPREITSPEFIFESASDVLCSALA